MCVSVHYIQYIVYVNLCILFNECVYKMYVPNGILPPDALRLHKTSGKGSPPTRH